MQGKTTFWIIRRLHGENGQTVDEIRPKVLRQFFAVSCQTGWQKNSWSLWMSKNCSFRLWSCLSNVRWTVNSGSQALQLCEYLYYVKVRSLWDKANLDSNSSFITWIWMTLGKLIRYSKPLFFNYEMGIIVPVTVNMKCDSLSCEWVIGIHCSCYEQWCDQMRIRFKKDHLDCIRATNW